MMLQPCALALLLVLASSCGRGGQPTAPDSQLPGLTTGQTVDLVTRQIGPAGGTIRVDRPGDAVDGMEISVPADAFAEAKEFTVSSAPIRGHQLGGYVDPISPLITIDWGGGYARQPVEVRIPIRLGAGDFAMGFFYDPATGSLEGIPIVALDDTSITIASMTFSAGSAAAKLAGVAEIPRTLRVLVSRTAESVLLSRGVISSGFVPGQDDWEFINYGSYAAPGGHCAGQSLTAMWYYYEQHLKGQPHLFHRLDTVNDARNPGLLWQDNPRGYRFASVIQKDFDFDGWIASVEFKSYFPGLTFKAFAVAILATGEPQSVLIRNSGTGAGHAMVVYAVDYPAGELRIADPNYPGNRAHDGTPAVRTISYRNGVLGPYQTGLVAGANSIAMDQIGYFAKTAYINWAKVGARWREVEDGTIGSAVFPACELRLHNDNDRALTDGAVTDLDTVQVYSWAPGAVGVGRTPRMRIDAFDTLGVLISNPADGLAGLAVVPLRNGTNRFGVYSRGFVRNDWSYLDFRWVEIQKYSLAVAPASVESKVNTELTWTANAAGTAPSPYRLVWSFGDSSPQQTVTNDPKVTHSFATAGSYTVTVRMYGDQGIELADARASAVIKTAEGAEAFIPPGCESAGTREEKADCMFTYVVRNGSSVSDVGRVTDSELRDWGYHWYATQHANILICDLIQDPQIKGWCRGE